MLLNLSLQGASANLKTSLIPIISDAAIALHRLNFHFKVAENLPQEPTEGRGQRSRLS